MKGIHITVQGRVQGVGFRYSASQAAARHRLTGWVRNLPSGGVEIYAEGPEKDLEAFKTWLAQGGPPGARVTSLDCRYREYTGSYPRFSIEY